MKEWFYKRWVKCGKRNCRSCPHGPYWYACWWDGHGTRNRYIGRDLPRAAAPPPDPPPHPWDAIFRRGEASRGLAWTILGVPAGSDRRTCQVAFVRAMRECHPDRHLGDAEKDRRARWLNAAWSYLIGVGF